VSLDLRACVLLLRLDVSCTVFRRDLSFPKCAFLCVEEKISFKCTMFVGRECAFEGILYLSVHIREGRSKVKLT
jgi:hypothetical protein